MCLRKKGWSGFLVRARGPEGIRKSDHPGAKTVNFMVIPSRSGGPKRFRIYPKRLVSYMQCLSKLDCIPAFQQESETL